MEDLNLSYLIIDVGSSQAVGPEAQSLGRSCLQARE